MKKGVVISLFVLSLFLIPLISAIDTKITIKTVPYAEVQITAYNPTTVDFQSYGIKKTASNRYGDAKLTLSLDKPEFGLIVFIKKDGEKLMDGKKFSEGFTAGEEIYLEVAPEGFEFIPTPEPEKTETPQETQNQTNNETQEIIPTEQEEIKQDKQLTGFSISSLKQNLSSYTYYIIGGVLLIILLVVLIKNKDKFKKSPKEPKEKSNEETIKDAEEKIRQAQEEIRRLRDNKQDKIAQAKKKLLEDEKELMRLRNEKD